MEILPFEAAIRDKRVLVTGHSGFTGGWLCLWLNAIGAEVYGIAKAPTTAPNLFDDARVGDIVESRTFDIADGVKLAAAIETIKPEMVFHLAAQPIVSRAYEDPAETFASNVIGTLNVLQAARTTTSVKSVVCVTTDKVYKDRDWDWGYREVDELGGADPYSASKACAELVAATYRQTLAPRGNGVQIITARGGNIIGGGDWSPDRIVPDFARAVIERRPLVLRRPESVRPWQHVLALVHGYLLIAARAAIGAPLQPSYNLGPADEDIHSVRSLVEAMSSAWQRPDIEFMAGSFHETRFLRLDSSLARGTIGWKPAMNFGETVRMTADWYRDYVANPSDAREVTLAQIDNYRARLRSEN